VPWPHIQVLEDTGKLQILSVLSCSLVWTSNMDIYLLNYQWMSLESHNLMKAIRVEHSFGT
jgi:hypothetical protein